MEADWSAASEPQRLLSDDALQLVVNSTGVTEGIITDGNLWRIVLNRRAHGIRRLRVPPVIKDMQWQEDWEVAADRLKC